MVGCGTDLAFFPEVDVGAEAWAYVQVEKFCMLESSVLLYVRTVWSKTRCELIHDSTRSLRPAEIAAWPGGTGRAAALPTALPL